MTGAATNPNANGAAPNRITNIEQNAATTVLTDSLVKLLNGIKDGSEDIGKVLLERFGPPSERKKNNRDWVYPNGLTVSLLTGAWSMGAHSGTLEQLLRLFNGGNGQAGEPSQKAAEPNGNANPFEQLGEQQSPKPIAPAVTPSIAEIIEQFTAAILQEGFDPPAGIIADGKMHRFRSMRQHKDKAGFYVLHTDWPPSGMFGCWRNNVQKTWTAKSAGELSPEQRAKLAAQVKAEQTKRQEELKEQYERVSQNATIRWNASGPAPAVHPYLVRKKIQPHFARWNGRDLLIPVMYGDKLWSLQTIDEDGEKRFMKDGRTGGCFALFGEPGKAILVAEGFATGASIHEATGECVALAFNHGNMEKVGKALRDLYPTAELGFCADDDWKTTDPNGNLINPGLTSATKAAALYNARVAVPVFDEPRGDRDVDFNDMAVLYGLERVREAIWGAKHEEPVAEPEGVNLTDFHALMTMHSFIFGPTCDLWPAESVNARLPRIGLVDQHGNPLVTEDGKQKTIKASTWLDQNRPVEQMTWCPGHPQIIHDKLVADGGWIDRRGVSVFNSYRAPKIKKGDGTKAGKWIAHVEKVYPNDAEHIIKWLAHRVQKPHEKLNHALVLGGKQGIGKDTILEPAKHGVGHWNFKEASPSQLLGRFNGFLESIILRVSEARDLGDVNRFAFYDHMKTIIATPPDVLPIDKKNTKEYLSFNVVGIIITTNHKVDGIYLPADDRRHYVGWSELDKDNFDENYWKDMWGWYERGGTWDVVDYLMSLDLSKFDPKAPPPKTQAFWEIVDSGRPSEDAEISDLLDDLGKPDALTIADLSAATRYSSGLAEWLSDRKSRRAIPHRMESAGYMSVRNEAAQDGLWKINDKRQVIYAKSAIPLGKRIDAARRRANR
jgi:phage/plasmid primase-like uncharacterized protein